MVQPHHCNNLATAGRAGHCQCDKRVCQQGLPQRRFAAAQPGTCPCVVISTPLSSGRELDNFVFFGVDASTNVLKFNNDHAVPAIRLLRTGGCGGSQAAVGHTQHGLPCVVGSCVVMVTRAQMPHTAL